MPTSSRRTALTRELLRVRDMAGISGRAMAKHLGVSQGTLWRYDAGRSVPSIPQVRTWLDVSEADLDTRARVLALAESALGETRPWRTLLADETHLQDDFQMMESQALAVRNFQSTIVPGLLQTPEYAARIIELADVSGRIDHRQALASRLERQEALYDPARRFVFLLAERVLSWSPSSVDVMGAQRDRIASLAELPAVEVAVVPETQTVVLPWHAFAMWAPADAPVYVTTEYFHGDQQLDDPEDVALYETVWDRLWSVAVVGDEAVEMLRRIGRNG